MPKVAICILSSEAPFDSASLGVWRSLPCIDFCLQDMVIGDTSIQALAAEDADFDLRHIEPACVLGCEVNLHAAQEFVGCALAQHIIKAIPEMGVQIVQHQMNAACPGIHTHEQFVNELDEVGFASMGGETYNVHSSLGLDRNKQVGRAYANVLVIQFGGNKRRHGQSSTVVTDELQAPGGRPAPT